MGVIGKQIGSRGLDAGSVGGLLASQKEQIAQALPQGFGRLLGDTGILDSLDGAGETAAAAASHAGRAANAAAAQAGQFASSASRSAGYPGQQVRAAAPATPNWVYWAIPALLVGGLLFYLFGRGAEQVAQQTTPTEQVTPRTPLPPTKQVTDGTTQREQGAARMAPAAQSVVVGGVDIGKQLGDNLSNLRTSLAGIADVESAKSALPKLQEATAAIEKVNGMVPQLSADQRTYVSNLVAPAIAAINQLFEKALAIPGVGDVLKPTVDNLKLKLADLSVQSSTVGGR
jgi:hypothetical protein